MSSTREVLDAVRVALSQPRISTYELAFGSRDPENTGALALYAWNAKVAAALLAPLHVCEVVIRNAVSEALEKLYGPRWPWDRTFLLSLPDPRGVYSPRHDLASVAAVQPTTGKVIPELKFVFWREMFTRRHDVRIWTPHFRNVLPCHDPTKSVFHLRRKMYANLDELRKLRNRIAHHEPIFTRDLRKDLELMVEVVEQRSPVVRSWMIANQDASKLLDQVPIFRGGRLWNPSNTEIAEIAYRIWEAEGRSSGSAVTDWAKAEETLGLFD